MSNTQNDTTEAAGIVIAVHDHLRKHNHGNCRFATMIALDHPSESTCVPFDQTIKGESVQLCMVNSDTGRIASFSFCVDAGAIDPDPKGDSTTFQPAIVWMDRNGIQSTHLIDDIILWPFGNDINVAVHSGGMPRRIACANNVHEFYAVIRGDPIDSNE